jgi:hypothetical protein
MTKFQSYTLRALTGVLALLFSGVVVTFLVNRLQVNATGYRQYAFGLLVGRVLYLVLHRLSTGRWPTFSG